MSEQMRAPEVFVVKHYQSEESPCIKGNGFDGLEIGQDREEAEEFIRWVNKYLAACQGAPETIQPEAVKALAEAVDCLLMRHSGVADMDPTDKDDIDNEAERKGRAALRLYHGDES